MVAKFAPSTLARIPHESVNDRDKDWPAKKTVLSNTTVETRAAWIFEGGAQMLAEQSASGQFLGQREKCFTDETGGSFVNSLKAG